MWFGKKKPKDEEPREAPRKLRPQLDRDAILFQSEVIGIAEAEFHSDAHCAAWNIRLYQDYLGDGSPTNRKAWIRARLQNEFRWVDRPPDWGKEGPEWPFWEDKPMVFLHQFGLPDSPVAREHATWDQMLFVFGIRIPRDGAYEMKYQIVERPLGLQTEANHIRESGN